MAVVVGKRVRIDVPVSDGGTRTVNGYALTGTYLAVTRALSGTGWHVTAENGGRRFPGRPFPTRAAAVEAVERLLELEPMAVNVAIRMARGTADDDDRRRLGRAWQAVLDSTSTVSRLDPYAGLRRELAAAVGDWEGTTRAVLADIGAEDWSYDGDVLTCPCGHPVEDDGQCPRGHVSPLRAAGLV